MDVRRYVQGGQLMQGLVIYAIVCFILGCVFINQGDTILGLAVCAAGPFWLAIANHKQTQDTQDDDWEND